MLIAPEWGEVQMLSSGGETGACGKLCGARVTVHLLGGSLSIAPHMPGHGEKSVKGGTGHSSNSNCSPLHCYQHRELQPLRRSREALELANRASSTATCPNLFTAYELCNYNETRGLEFPGAGPLAVRLSSLLCGSPLHNLLCP